MIKTLIILALLVILAAGAALSRPSEESFQGFYRTQAQEKATGLVGKLLTDAKTEDYIKHCTYKNRILWADVEYGGQTVYTGAFSHWFSRSAAAVPAK
jgi:hypothetical protein